MMTLEQLFAVVGGMADFQLYLPLYTPDDYEPGLFRVERGKAITSVTYLEGGSEGEIIEKYMPFSVLRVDSDIANDGTPYLVIIIAPDESSVMPQ